VEVSVNAHLKGPLKPTPGSQVLHTVCVPLSREGPDTRTKNPWNAEKIVSRHTYINKKGQYFIRFFKLIFLYLLIGTKQLTD
jgi:hypothetical protein